MALNPDCDDLYIAHHWSTDIPSGVTTPETVKSSMCYLTYWQTSKIDSIIVQSVILRSLHLQITSEHL